MRIAATVLIAGQSLRSCPGLASHTTVSTRAGSFMPG